MPHEFDEIWDLNEQVMMINFADMNIRWFTNIDHPQRMGNCYQRCSLSQTSMA